VTSDHGEGLGDHGNRHHGGTVYNSEVRVPLVIAGPTITPGREPNPIGLSSLAATLLELAGYEPAEPRLMDRPFTGALRGTPAELAPPYVSTKRDSVNPIDSFAVISGRYKLVDHSGKRQLFDLRIDPDETNDLLLTEPVIAARLRKLLEEARERDELPAR
jgi:arylsulfatase A-like enzyme